MLPPHITIVMLSATLPNVMDFADWVGRTKNRVVYVSGALSRPLWERVELHHREYRFAVEVSTCNNLPPKLPIHMCRPARTCIGGLS